jgi:hypothetical protein
MIYLYSLIFIKNREIFINIKELKGVFNMLDQNLLTIEKIRDQNYEINTDLCIKSYLSLSTKKVLIKKILDLCVFEEDVKKIDFALKQFAYEYMLINQYTNINFEVDNITEIYDELKENKLIENILKNIPESEINFINYVLDKEIEQIQLFDNSLVNIVSNSLNKLVEKLPDQKGITKLIKELPKQINKIDPSKFKFLTDAISWNNGEKKDA